MNRIIRTILIMGILIITIHQYCPAKENSLRMPEIIGKNREHTAEEWEDLYPIAKRNGLAIEHIMWANGMSDIKTYGGQKLQIPVRRIEPSVRFTNGLVINLPERGIHLYKNGKYVKFYPVAIGVPGKFATPTGDMKIITKVKNPTWLPPEWANKEEPVPAGPDNPLGDRWMGLDHTGIGIHATNSPVSIGLAASHGCMRMYPEMAHELFDEVYLDMPVKIVYEPVKVGYSPESRQVFIEVYPDIYDKTKGLMEEARRVLNEYGLLGLVEESRLEEAVSKKNGVAVPILGSDISVKVNDRDFPVFFPPVMKDGKVWVSSEVLKPIGATSMWNNKDKTIDIYYGKKKVSLKVRKPDESGDANNDPAVSYLLQGRAIIPAGYVFKQLGINFQWQAKPPELLLFSPDYSRQGSKKNSEAKPSASPAKTPSSPKPSPAPTADVKSSPSPPKPSPTAPLPVEIPDDLPDGLDN